MSASSDGEVTTRVRLAVNTAEKRFRSRIALAITICGLFTAASGVAAVGFHGGKALDQKADVRDMQVLRGQQIATDTKVNDFGKVLDRLETKVDWLIAHYPTSAASPRRGH